MKRTMFAAILGVFLLAGCSAGDTFFDLMLKLRGGKFSTQEMVLDTGKEKISLTVEVADSERERQRGYMHREKIEDGRGMWFVFDDEAPRQFWMKNTLVSLDILFLNSANEIVSIMENMEPCTAPQCPSYASKKPAMYALELPAGTVKAKKISVGDKVNEKE